MSDCLFCKIIQGEIPSKKVYEDDEVFAFHDINPAAPTHILVTPKKHISRISEADDSDQMILGGLLLAAKKIAEENKLQDYRLVFNNGEGAGQTVFHIHLHLLGGRPMTWPPG